MRILEIVLRSSDDKVPATAVVRTEVHDGSGWKMVETVNIQSGTEGASRKIILDDDERLVFEPHVVEEMVYDREQFHARPMTPEEKHERLKEVGTKPDGSVGEARGAKTSLGAGESKTPMPAGPSAPRSPDAAGMKLRGSTE